MQNKIHPKDLNGHIKLLMTLRLYSMDTKLKLLEHQETLNINQMPESKLTLQNQQFSNFQQNTQWITYLLLAKCKSNIKHLMDMLEFSQYFWKKETPLKSKQTIFQKICFPKVGKQMNHWLQLIWIPQISQTFKKIVIPKTFPKLSSNTKDPLLLPLAVKVLLISLWLHPLKYKLFY